MSSRAGCKRHHRIFRSDGKRNVRPSWLSPLQGICVNHVGSSGRHLLDLINDVLDLSRLDAGKTGLHEEVFDLNAILLPKLIGMMSLKRRLRDLPANELAPGPLDVRADRRRILQVALNLVANAVKFTPEKGAVSLPPGTLGDGANSRQRHRNRHRGPRHHESAHPVWTGRHTWSRKYAGTGLGLPLPSNWRNFWWNAYHREHPECRHHRYRVAAAGACSCLACGRLRSRINAKASWDGSGFHAKLTSLPASYARDLNSHGSVRSICGRPLAEEPVIDMEVYLPSLRLPSTGP